MHLILFERKPTLPSIPPAILDFFAIIPKTAEREVKKSITIEINSIHSIEIKPNEIHFWFRNQFYLHKKFYVFCCLSFWNEDDCRRWLYIFEILVNWRDTNFSRSEIGNVLIWIYITFYPYPQVRLRHEILIYWFIVGNNGRFSKYFGFMDAISCTKRTRNEREKKGSKFRAIHWKFDLYFMQTFCSNMCAL